MIFSSFAAKDDISRYPEAIQKALEYIKAHDFKAMEPGVYEIQGKDMYAQVSDVMTETGENKRPEVHEKYIDVQFLVSGKERIGVTWDTGMYEVAERLDEKDLIFYKAVEHEGYLDVAPGCYSIFFPEDVHRPGLAVGEPMKIRKVIVKVSVNLLA